jgi:hypothetical protein
MRCMRAMPSLSAAGSLHRHRHQCLQPLCKPHTQLHVDASTAAESGRNWELRLGAAPQQHATPTSVHAVANAICSLQTLLPPPPPPSLLTAPNPAADTLPTPPPLDPTLLATAASATNSSSSSTAGRGRLHSQLSFRLLALAHPSWCGAVWVSRATLSEARHAPSQQHIACLHCAVSSFAVRAGQAL